MCAANYDFLGQLISADSENQTDESYVYDANGNRLTANGDTYTTGTNNELTSDGNYTYTYDAEGNRISKTNPSGTERELYTWDYRNRLTTVTKQTYDTTTATWPTVQIVEYTYDYNNIWIRKVVGDSKTIFIPEAYQTAVQIDNGTVSHHYLWTPNQQDKLLADTTPTEVLWSLTDHLGTIRDVLGATTTHLIYDAFGNLTSGTNPLLFGYTGKAFDTATHLQNNINRWYDAIVGRWLSIDPIGFEGNDINLYRYIKNCVTIHSDLMGFQASLFYTDPGLQIMQKNQEAFKENERKNTKSYFDYLKKLKPLCDGLDSCEAKKAGCSKQACLDYMAKVAGFMVKADYEAGGFRKFRASNRLLSWCFPDPYGGHCTLWTAMYMEHSSPWPQEACVVVKLHILSFTEGQWEVHSIIQLKNRFTGKNMLLDNGAWGHVYPPDEANPQQTPMVPESAQLLKDLMREEKDPLFHKTKETL